MELLNKNSENKILEKQNKNRRVSFTSLEKSTD
jgi:hypothetical protein